MAFKPATRKRVKARLVMAGLSKSGKSLKSLAILRGIVGPEGRIAAIDTENGALSLYAGRFPGTKQPSGFDVQDLTNCSPDAYVNAIAEAAKAKYDGLLIDSTSQEWGAVLELVDGQADKFFGGWKVATPKHNEFLRAIVSAPMHVIATVRQNDEYVIENINGKSTPRKVGLGMVQRKQFEYEFNAVMTVDLEHNIRVMHSAIDFLPNGTIIPPFESLDEAVTLGEHIQRWLDAGEEEWTPPVYKKSFYLQTTEGPKEIISGGIERDTYVKLTNAGAALEKATKRRGSAKELVAAKTGKTKIADLTEEEGKDMLIALQSAARDAGKEADA